MFGRQFIQMSYKFEGSGTLSRDPQFIVHQCIRILYAFRCIYVLHCLVTIPDWQFTQPELLSKSFLNSTAASAFTAIQNIKRPAKQCIPDHHKQHVTWTDEGFTALEVHTGISGLGRTPVSHVLLRTMFKRMLQDIQSELDTIGEYVFMKMQPFHNVFRIYTWWYVSMVEFTHGGIFQWWYVSNAV